MDKPEVQLGEVLVVPREEGGWCAAVRTPLGTSVHGDCPLEAYYRGKVYFSSSRREPSAPHEIEGLRWGVGKMVEEATGKVADLSFWTPPGLLFEVYWGESLLALYWKRGESDFLELWTPELFLHLDRERGPEAWWALNQALARNSHYVGGSLRKVDVGREVSFEIPFLWKGIDPPSFR
jgi:hypothetical protein